MEKSTALSVLCHLEADSAETERRSRARFPRLTHRAWLAQLERALAAGEAQRSNLPHGEPVRGLGHADAALRQQQLWRLHHILCLAVAEAYAHAGAAAQGAARAPRRTLRMLQPRARCAAAGLLRQASRAPCQARRQGLAVAGELCHAGSGQACGLSRHRYPCQACTSLFALVRGAGPAGSKQQGVTTG